MILLIWLLSIVHGGLFILSTPQWEGIDEAFHYGYVQHLAESGTLPVFGRTAVSKELVTSFRFAPVSTVVNANLGNLYTSFPDYWRLPEAERKARENALRKIPPSHRAIPDDSANPLMNYEAQHPPLYYFLCAGIYRLFSDSDQPTLTLLLRWFSLLIGSLTIPIAYAVAKEGRFPWSPHFVPLLIALLPMFISTVSRISNDCLGVTLFSCLILLVCRYINSGFSRKYAVWIGVIAGLGLLTKAYFLAAIPPIAAVLLFAGFKRRGFALSARHMLLVGFVCLALSGLWYARNYIHYGTISGLFVLASERAVSPGEYLGKLFEIPWQDGLKIIFRQQIWTGNSSFIGLSRTIYRSAYLLVFLAFLGIARIYWCRIRKKEFGVCRDAETLDAMVLFCLFFVLGMLYQMFSTYVATGRIVTGGWYLNAVVIPGVTILVLGLSALRPRSGGRIRALLVAYVLLINFLAYFCKAIPYYSGFIIARFHLNHFFELYSPANIGNILDRLSLNKPEFITPGVIGAWILLYVAIVVAVLVAPTLRRRLSAGRTDLLRRTPGV